MRYLRKTIVCGFGCSKHTFSPANDGQHLPSQSKLLGHPLHSPGYVALRTMITFDTARMLSATKCKRPPNKRYVWPYVLFADVAMVLFRSLCHLSCSSADCEDTYFLVPFRLKAVCASQRSGLVGFRFKSVETCSSVPLPSGNELLVA